MTENESKQNIITYALTEAENLPKSMGTAFDMAVKALEEVQQYREIGTLDECREAMESRETSKIVDGITECCGYDFGADGFSTEIARYCPMCGRKLDWSTEE